MCALLTSFCDDTKKCTYAISYRKEMAVVNRKSVWGKIIKLQSTCHINIHITLPSCGESQPACVACVQWKKNGWIISDTSRDFFLFHFLSESRRKRGRKNAFVASLSFLLVGVDKLIPCVCSFTPFFFFLKPLSIRISIYLCGISGCCCYVVRDKKSWTSIFDPKSHVVLSSFISYCEYCDPKKRYCLEIVILKNVNQFTIRKVCFMQEVL